MICFSALPKALFAVLLVFIHGCAVVSDEISRKGPPTGLITTPPSYYSTAKARYLGEKYKENLNHIVEKIVRNPKTANLQFANNIASVGGIGFFTHSAARVPDERYLEVVLATPQTFDRKGDYSAKVQRLFSLYGADLLQILSSDIEIYQEKEVAGYGLNLSWRTLVADPSTPRVIVERAIAYLSKEKVRAFLKKEVAQNNLLGGAVIFGVEDDGPLTLVSIRAEERKPDFRPPIQEEILAAGAVKSERKASSVAQEPDQPKGQTDAAQKMEQPERQTSSATGLPTAPSPVPVVEAAKRESAPQEKTGGPTPTEKRAVPGAEVSVPSAAKASAPAVAAGVPARPSISKGEPKAMQEKPEPAGGTAPSPAPVVEAAKRESAPQEKTGGPTPTEKRAMPGAEVPVPSAAKADMSGATPGPSAQRPISAPRELPADVSGSQAKMAGAVVGQRDVAKQESPGAGSPSTPQVRDSKGKSSLSPGVAMGSGGAGSVRAVDEIRPQPASEGKSASEVTVPETKITSLAPDPRSGDKQPERSPAASKPEVKTTEREKRPPVPAPPSKAVPSAAPTGDLSAQAESVERQTPRQQIGKEKSPDVTNAAVTPTKANEKSLPAVGSTSPDRTAPAVQAGQLSPPQTEGTLETKALASSASAARALTPRSETSTVVKERIATPSPAPRIEEKAAARNLPASQTKEIADKPAREEIALLTGKVGPQPPPSKPITRSVPKRLEGYIIQLSFTDKAAAQQWAETLERRGHAVSVTEAVSSGSIRVRIGNFPGRDEAERELRSLGRDGLRGIVLNLPEGYRPRVGASASADEAESVPAVR